MTTTIRPIEQKTNEDDYKKRAFAGVTVVGEKLSIGGSEYELEMAPRIYEIATTDSNFANVKFLIQGLFAKRTDDGMRFAIIATNLANTVLYKGAARGEKSLFDNTKVALFDYCMIINSQNHATLIVEDMMKDMIDRMANYIRDWCAGISGKAEEIILP